MNYIELINWFWELDESWQFSCCETRLYFYLVKTANRLGWENSWTHSDDKTAANVGVSAKTMKNARNRLIQAGLISGAAGGKGRGDKFRYQIFPPLGQPLGNPKRHPFGQPKGQPIPYIEDKLNQTKGSMSNFQKFDDPQLPLGIPDDKFNEKEFVEEVRVFFNEHCKSLNPVKTITSSRHKAVMARYREHGRDAIFDTLKNAGKSKFLAGQSQSGWTADFNWIFRPENFVKVYEEKYDDNQRPTGRAAGPAPAQANDRLNYTTNYRT